MSNAGDTELETRVRTTLLDALDALELQREALVLVGALAVYLHTGATQFALAEYTEDSDLAVDPRVLTEDPRLEEAMEGAKFHPHLEKPQPGRWLSRDGVPVDLMTPAMLSGQGGKRGARIPPHSSHATRRTAGLEVALVDNELFEIEALAPGDTRSASIKVAGPAALLVAKLHKLAERQGERGRFNDKDAHDVYRLLVAIDSDVLAGSLGWLVEDPLAGESTARAIHYLERLFGTAGDGVGARMAGDAERTVGVPETVTASSQVLADDVLEGLRRG